MSVQIVFSSFNRKHSNAEKRKLHPFTTTILQQRKNNIFPAAASNLRAGDWRAGVSVGRLTGVEVTLEKASLLLVTLTTKY